MTRHLLLNVRALFAALLLLPTVILRSETVREPAVAGIFYPEQREVLSHLVDQLLDRATTTRQGDLKALICPHAGYAYSGPVAAAGFRLLRGLHFKNVIILGPAHFAALDQASVSSADVFRTPLGDLPVSPAARLLAKRAPFALDPRCYVEPPDWVPAAARSGPGATRAGTWEHADEVELPFLQKTLGEFAVVPVVMGEVDPADAARALAPMLDADTLLVVSSDLSHYHPYAEARKLDQQTVDAICALDVRKMARQEACGRTPILTLLEIAKTKHWRPKLLDFRNSGDTSGDKSRVVGYAAIAFYAPTADDALSGKDRQLLLELARQSVRDAAAGRPMPTVDPAKLSPELAVKKGVFVTLTKHGELRGCIGHILPQMSLYAGVAENARSAAIHDPRFPPVTPREVDDLHIEISVLTEPKPLPFASPDDLLQQLRPGIDGVVLQLARGRGATYLPQVWEQLPDKTEFLDALAEKAGGRATDWRQPGTTVATYQVISFEEAKR